LCLFQAPVRRSYIFAASFLIQAAGTNLQALIDACASSRIPDARVLRVFSNRKTAYGLIRAADATPQIPTDYLALQTYLKANPDKSRVDYDLEVARKILTATFNAGDDIDLVVLAGWMHVLSAEFLDVFCGARPFDTDTGRTVSREIPIINLHPALPGAFDGARAIERAFEAYGKGEINHTGAMVHRVVKEVDRGEPIIVREVEIVPEDNLAALEQRIHNVEHDILIESVIKVLAELK
jgi:phosphoribosylglycinamide formyltransferase